MTGTSVEASRAAWVEQVMGLPVSIHVRGPSARDRATSRAVAQVYAQLRAADARFSTYRADSEVSRLRAGEVVAPSPDLAQVQQLCALARATTGGSFDADLPGGFDPCGLVKGWALERASLALHALDAEVDWLVNAGGDVLLRAGAGRSWRVGVEDPTDKSRVQRVLTLRGGAVATSGTAHRGAHIVDPATGRAAGGGVLAATVVGPSLLWADVFATAAVVKGASAPEWLAGLQGYRGWVNLSERAELGGTSPPS